MPNNLYKSIGNNSPLPAPFGNMQNMMAQFNQFRNSFSGNPQQQVQQLLNSGRMSQQQFNQLRNMADKLQNFFR